MTDGSITIQNCYTTGNISGNGAGGIAGAELGNSMSGGSITIQNCYTIGEISGNSAGGIAGAELGFKMKGDSITIQNNIYNDSGNNKPLIGSISKEQFLTNENNITQSDNNWSYKNALNTIFSQNTWGTTYSENIINNNRWFLLSNIENDITIVFIIENNNNNNHRIKKKMIFIRFT